jgi:hypothetical protein
MKTTGTSLPSINDIKELFSEVECILRVEAEKDSIKWDVISKEEKQKTDAFISKMISFFQRECERIKKSFIEEIEEILQNDEQDPSFVINSLEVLRGYDEEGIHRDFLHYSLDADFRYAAPLMCTEVFVKNLIKVELIDSLKEVILQKEIEHRDLFIRAKAFSKIQTTLTVKELVYLFKVLYEKKILLPKHKTDLYRLISNSFTTKRSDEIISEQSIKNNFVDVTPATMEKIRLLTLELHQYIGLEKSNPKIT